ncbi:MAG: type II secretion system F family protein [Lachnospiraceae bacterium]|nr:type II secretion system F family protein [Lachnospiraceae bacterium]
MYLLFSVLGTVLGILCLLIFLTEKGKYAPIIGEIDEKEYFIKEIFVVGFTMMQKLHIDISSEVMQKKIHKLTELFGKKESRKIAIYDLAAEISYVIVFLPVVLLLTVITNEMSIMLIGLGLIIFLIIYMEYDKVNKLTKRHETIDREFPHMVSQMALLVNAGMPLREALVKSSAKSSGILSEEMKVLVNDMENGIPDYAALDQFAARCGVESVRKFSSLVSQNIKKGSAELADSLLALSSEIWRNRVSTVRMEGEKASTRLLLPILIIFGGIIMMVVVPMLSGMGGLM